MDLPPMRLDQLDPHLQEVRWMWEAHAQGGDAMRRTALVLLLLALSACNPEVGKVVGVVSDSTRRAALHTLFFGLCISFGPHAREALALGASLGPIVWVAPRIAGVLRPAEVRP